MRVLHKGLMLSCLPLLLLSAAAVGGVNEVDVVISNDSTDDVMVTVYDVSTHPSSTVLSARINGFTHIPIALSLDESGRGNIAWTAVSVDERSRKCGQDTNTGLTSSQAVKVHADAECGGP